MPLKPTRPSEAAPKAPHLVLITDDGGLALPPGTRIILVEDAGDVTKQFPLILKSVHHKKLVFAVGNTDYEYRLVSGKPLTREAMQRMKQSRGE